MSGHKIQYLNEHLGMSSTDDRRQPHNTVKPRPTTYVLIDRSTDGPEPEMVREVVDLQESRPPKHHRPEKRGDLRTLPTDEQREWGRRTYGDENLAYRTVEIRPSTDFDNVPYEGSSRRERQKQRIDHRVYGDGRLRRGEERGNRELDRFIEANLEGRKGKSRRDLEPARARIPRCDDDRQRRMSLGHADELVGDSTPARHSRGELGPDLERQPRQRRGSMYPTEDQEMNRNAIKMAERALIEPPPPPPRSPRYRARSQRYPQERKRETTSRRTVERRPRRGEFLFYDEYRSPAELQRLRERVDPWMNNVPDGKVIDGQHLLRAAGKPLEDLYNPQIGVRNPYHVNVAGGVDPLDSVSQI